MNMPFKAPVPDLIEELSNSHFDAISCLLSFLFIALVLRLAQTLVIRVERMLPTSQAPSCPDPFWSTVAEQLSRELVLGRGRGRDVHLHCLKSHIAIYSDLVDT